jgi:S-adenosylmethionine synthetase
MSTTTLVVLTVVEIVVLIAGLAFFLFWIGSLLTRIAANLEECAKLVRTVNRHAADIVPGVEHINRTGKVVASALPLLYGFAERIVANVTPTPPPVAERVTKPASGTRRSRLHETVGFRSG